MTFAEKMDIHLKTGWSDRIISNIDSMAEACIYIKAGLKEAVVGGRPALIRTDIEWSAFNCRKEWLKTYLTDWGKWEDYNNADLIGEGYPPRDSKGDPYELHHIGQRQNSPLAELTCDEHKSGGNFNILHKSGKESEIDRGDFDDEKSAYWQARYKMFSESDIMKIYGPESV